MSSSVVDVPTSIYIFADTLLFSFPVASWFRSLCCGIYHFFSLEYLGPSWYLESIYFFKNWDSTRISLKSPQSEVITPYTKLMCIYSNKSQLIIIFSSPVWFLFHSFKMSLTSLLGMFLTAMSPGYLLSWAAKCDVKSCPSSIFNSTYRILHKLLNYLKCLGLNSLMCKWR